MIQYLIEHQSPIINYQARLATVFTAELTTEFTSKLSAEVTAESTTDLTSQLTPMQMLSRI